MILQKCSYGKFRAKVCQCLKKILKRNEDLDDIDEINSDQIKQAVQEAYEDLFSVLLKYLQRRYKGRMFAHGYYSRSIRIFDTEVRLRVHRLLFIGENGKIHTQAVLPSFLIPYSQMITEDLLYILTAPANTDPASKPTPAGNRIDYTIVNYVKKRYRRWAEHFKCDIIGLCDIFDLKEKISASCEELSLVFCGIQFMQFHSLRCLCLIATN